MVVNAPASMKETFRVMRTHHVNPLVGSLIAARGLQDALVPELTLAPLAGLDAVSDRIKLAIDRKERITVFGDYDADGVTSTSIIALGLSELGAVVRWVVPERLTDGYGLSEGFTEEIIETTDVLITVDTGINATKVISALTNAGVTVIVTDHHSVAGELPDCFVIHPQFRSDDAAGESLGLTGAGVAWHVVWGVRRVLGNTEPPLWLSDLAAVGTVADVGDVTVWNRALVKAGFVALRDSEHPGFRLVVDGDGSKVSTSFVGFQLAPLLNAAGRLNQASVAVQFLLERDAVAAEVRLRELRALNEERKALTEVVSREAIAAAVVVDDPIVALENTSWHPGVIGIAAARVLEATGKSAFLSSGGKGSVRVSEGHHALMALRAASEHLTVFGGHTKAAGYTLRDPSDVTGFQRALAEYAKENPQRASDVTVDAVLHPNAVHPSDTVDFVTLEPFGPRNPTPAFGVVGAVKEVRGFGRGNVHSRVRLFSEGALAGGVLWNRKPEGLGLVGDEVVLVGELVRSDWGGRVGVELSGRSVVGDLGGGVGEWVFRRVVEGAVVVSGGSVVPEEFVGLLFRLVGGVGAGRRLSLVLSSDFLVSLEAAAVALPSAVDALRLVSGDVVEGSFAARVVEECGGVPGCVGDLFGSVSFLRVWLVRFVVLNFVVAYRHFGDADFERFVLGLFLGD
jgi:single-stranded-DNA-specific exonuclease